MLKACTNFSVQQKKLQETFGNVRVVFDIDLKLAVASYMYIIIYINNSQNLLEPWY